ncbi:hypothetical protein AGABI1DRAFT_108226 [Agaricus bisporus var. burnettii JB137-S8]|uniref:Uncharacterized protein n=1 Tax=Agaricus bisporus var. burnettii (strain JB137-S8 / ATCC MYA-4627 / FGSC 10392) TaxID=597362 RepID=K5X387_AGABU|nr:uncharacterized protein AGABI1DRAFT_108226 [Agaricus bisporus var. burnettii JB137-S8]EKM77397.1 hypothetical protein AGABI1DRAFT_108226 [Agaricus bisporus var. burnettii JB137-S8]
MSVNEFPITAAQLSGILCETLFYGIYLVTCCFVTRTLLITGNGGEGKRWVRRHEVRWVMASVAVLLFLISTWDVSIGILHLFNAFIKAEDATLEFTNITDWINIARSVNQVLTMIIGDSVLIYRCWIVYERRWLVITPSLFLYLGSIAMAIKILETECNPATIQSITLNSSQIRPWYATFFGINAVQNFLTTGILIWRIWRIEREIDKYIVHCDDVTTRQPRYLQKVMRIIAESGAAYTLIVITTFLVDISGSNALYPTSDMASYLKALQATGIAFNVILIRSSAKRTQQIIMVNERLTTMSLRAAENVAVDAESKC